MKRKKSKEPLARLAVALSVALVAVVGCIAFENHKSIIASRAQAEHAEQVLSWQDENGNSLALPAQVQVIPAQESAVERTALEPIVSQFSCPYYKQITENISITLPALPEQTFDVASSFDVQLKYFNLDALGGYFWDNEYLNLQKSESEYVRSVASPDGRSLTVWQYKDPPVETSEFLYTTSEYKAISSIFSFHDELTDDTIYFPEDMDLDFMTRKEATEQAMAIMSDLNIPVMTNPRVITLDAVSLNKSVDKIKQTNYWDTIKPSNRMEFDKSWTKKDEIYIIIFQTSFLGKPVSYYANVSFNDSIPTRSIALVAINREGIAAVTARSIYRLSKENKQQTILSFDEAVNAVSAYYDQFIITRPIDFARARLEMVPSRGNASVLKLSPMWVFSYELVMDGRTAVGYENRSVDHTIWLDHVFVNGITGEVAEP